MHPPILEFASLSVSLLLPFRPGGPGGGARAISASHLLVLQVHFPFLARRCQKRLSSECLFCLRPRFPVVGQAVAALRGCARVDVGQEREPSRQLLQKRIVLALLRHRQKTVAVDVRHAGESQQMPLQVFRRLWRLWTSIYFSVDSATHERPQQQIRDGHVAVEGCVVQRCVAVCVRPRQQKRTLVPPGVVNSLHTNPRLLGLFEEGRQNSSEDGEVLRPSSVDEHSALARILHGEEVYPSRYIAGKLPRRDRQQIVTVPVAVDPRPGRTAGVVQKRVFMFLSLLAYGVQELLPVH
mmetsp:Transcript_22237/g.56113  ORF Transcript_22237/g.56113 Transcript_22237/m.56113 type:complete len:296 (+) Transcript_22237:299-1186(+)